ncbi:MAG TPA: hypothetical protein PLZ08_12145 [Bacillota bacterium]|jgi:hypothetical protein|nr:hypothetical protein [Bacillota bacterium]HOL09524.1 hypothetical protein [Bacillota bacterium]HPO98689.1 hypothetical protein [Bacillota bacterium]
MLRKVLLLLLMVLLVSLPVTTVSVAKTPEVKLLTTTRDEIEEIW